MFHVLMFLFVALCAAWAEVGEFAQLMGFEMPGPEVPFVERSSKHFIIRSYVGEAKAVAGLKDLEAVRADLARELPGLRMELRARMDVVVHRGHNRRHRQVVAGFYDHRTGIAHVIDGGSIERNRPTLRHEATHQLMHRAMGMPIVSGESPFWYREGLACCFEGTGRMQLGALVPLNRIGVLEVVYSDRALPPVKEILSLRRGASGRPAIVDYALVWSFVHFLMHGDERAHRATFLAWLGNVQDWRRRRLDHDLFEKVFADPEAYHAGWTKHVAILVRGNPADHIPKIEWRPEEIAKLAPPTRVERQQVWGKIVGVFNTLGSKEWDEAFRALFLDLRQRAAAIQLLSTGDLNMKRLVAESLGRGRCHEALPTLIELSLRAAEPELRRTAAMAVRHLNYGIAPRKYFDLMRGQGPAAMQRIVEALEWIGDPYAVQSLKAVRAQIGTRTVVVQGQPETEFGSGRVRFGALRTPRRFETVVGRNPAEEQLAKAVDRALLSLAVPAVRGERGERVEARR